MGSGRHERPLPSPVGERVPGGRVRGRVPPRNPPPPESTTRSSPVAHDDTMILPRDATVFRRRACMALVSHAGLRPISPGLREAPDRRASGRLRRSVERRLWTLRMARVARGELYQIRRAGRRRGKGCNRMASRPVTGGSSLDASHREVPVGPRLPGDRDCLRRHRYVGPLRDEGDLLRPSPAGAEPGERAGRVSASSSGR